MGPGAFFAFITTLLREIIKDIEDYDGDKEYGCKTMPIVIGIPSSKFVVVILSAITMTILAYFQVLQFSAGHMKPFYYFLFGLQLPFVFLIWKTWTAQTKKEFRRAGNTAKLIMLVGVCYLFIFAYSLLSAQNAV